MTPPEKCKTQHWQIKADVTVKHDLPPSGSASEIARMFGLSETIERALYNDFEIEFSPGQICAITGPSGSGKSVLLKQFRKQIPKNQLIELGKISRADRAKCAADLLGKLSTRDALAILSRIGLAEAALLTTPAGELSEGQQYRLSLARALTKAKLSRKAMVLLADEFCSSLDVITAAILCRQIRKLISRENLAFVVATPRAEILPALKPDKIITKPVDEPAKITTLAERQSRLPDPANWAVTRGNIWHYRELARYHYIADAPACHKRVYKITVPEIWQKTGCPKTAAVLVVSPPIICVRGRNVATNRRYIEGGRAGRTAGLKLMNQELEAISRVIVHPIFRGCGLAGKLIRHAIATSPVKFIESLAAMGKIHPMFEAAGLSPVGLFRGRTNYYNYYIGKTPAADAIAS